MPTFLITDPSTNDTVAITHNTKSGIDFRRDFDNCVIKAGDILKSAAKSFQIISTETLYSEALFHLLKMKGYKKLEISTSVEFVKNGYDHIMMQWTYADKNTNELLISEDFNSVDSINKWNEKARKEQNRIKSQFNL